MWLTDARGEPWARVAHKKAWKSQVTVTDAAGSVIGTMAQQNVMGEVRLGIDAGGHQLGELRADGTRLQGWSLTDHANNPIGRIENLGRYASYGLVQHRNASGRYVLTLSGSPRATAARPGADRTLGDRPGVQPGAGGQEVAVPRVRDRLIAMPLPDVTPHPVGSSVPT